MNKIYNANDMVKWLVMAADFAILNIILAIIIYWDSIPVPNYFHYAVNYIFLTANMALFISETFFSSIIHVRKVRLIQVLGRTLRLAVATSLCFYFILVILTRVGDTVMKTSFFLCIMFYAVLIISRIAELNLLKFYRSKGRNIRTVMFVGNDPAIIDMYNRLMEDPSAGYRVYGYYADSPINNAPKDLKMLGNMDKLNAVMSSTINNTIKGETSSIDEVFCCLSHARSEEIVRIMQFCDKNVIHFYYLPRQFGEYRLHLDSQTYLGKNVFSNHNEPLASLSNRILKRSFDILVSGIICLCILPFLPLIALCIKIQSPGPIFFKQARTGLNGETFSCLKFRSMHVNKDADLVQATKDDPRKFAFGNFMRKTNLDEFPQFFNVLKGDMSIVGPRPHMLHHTEIYGKLIDKYMVRHFSKPGITGWAQVTGYRGETKELWQMEERIRRDIWYIENWSFWLDIKIIFMTAKSIVCPDKEAY